MGSKCDSRNYIPLPFGWIQFMRDHARLGKFIIVGCLNTFVSYIIFSALLIVTHSDNLAIVMTWMVGSLFNFFSTGRLVFDNRDNTRIFIFIVSNIFNMALNVLFLKVLTASGFGPFLAQAVCLPAVVIFSYLMSAKLVFRKINSRQNGSAAS